MSDLRDGIRKLEEIFGPEYPSLDAARYVSGGRPGRLGFEALDDLIVNVEDADVEDAYSCRECGVYVTDFHPLPDKTVLCVPCWRRRGRKLLPPGPLALLAVLALGCSSPTEPVCLDELEAFGEARAAVATLEADPDPDPDRLLDALVSLDQADAAYLACRTRRAS